MGIGIWPGNQTGPQGEKGDTGATGATGATGPGYLATSATSFAIGTGSKAFTTQAGLAYVAGDYARAISRADPTNYMEGSLTSYSGTTWTLNSTITGGSGTHTDWDLTLFGKPGATGATGPSGAVNGWIDVSADALGVIQLADATVWSIGDGNIITDANGLAITIPLYAQAGSILDKVRVNWFGVFDTGVTTSDISIDVLSRVIAAGTDTWTVVENFTQAGTNVDVLTEKTLASPLTLAAGSVYALRVTTANVTGGGEVTIYTLGQHYTTRFS